MKFCPNCGNKLETHATSFCPECGFKLSAEIREKLKSGKKNGQKYTDKTRALDNLRKRPTDPSESAAKNDDGYDGYYDDVRSDDEDNRREGIDKEVVKKIMVLIAAMLFIVGGCAVLMYLL